MILSFNKVIIGGNVTRDPQVRFLANEKAVAEFGIAVNRKWKVDGETKEETTFCDVKAWGRTAELVGQYVQKGRNVLVEGRLQMEQWSDKESGQKRTKHVIVADSVQFLGDPAHRGETSAARNGDAVQPGQDAPPRSRPSIPAAGGGDDEPPFHRSELELMA